MPRLFRSPMAPAILPSITGQDCNREKPCWSLARRAVSASPPWKSANSWARASSPARADHLIDATDGDIRAEMKALGGADVVFDPVGGEQFTAAFRSCRPEGRILTIGFASGNIPQIKANHLLVKNLSVLGLYWGGYLAFRPEILTRSLHQLMEWHAAARIKPHVSHVLPLEQAAEGMDLLRRRKSTGKVVISIW